MLSIKFLASSEMTTPSGNEYWFMRMRLYVALMSEVSKGGLPTRMVYKITPMDHTSTWEERKGVGEGEGAKGRRGV
jgi:hypothetical protein